MRDLKRLAVLVAVVDAGSFTAAARELGLSKSAVSQQIALLEREHGVQLLQRSTRSLRVTHTGERVYRAARRMVEAAQEGLGVLEAASCAPQGVLHVAAPVGIGEAFIAPILARFLKAHPELEATLDLSDRAVHLINEGYDIAIRAGALEDSAFMVRRLAEIPLVVCASPTYFGARPLPQNPSDLGAEDWVLFAPLGDALVLRKGRYTQNISIGRGRRLRTNHGPAVLSTLLEGLGLGVLPEFYARNALESRRLITVLPEWSPGCVPISALYASKENLPAKISVFLEWLHEAHRDV